MEANCSNHPKDLYGETDMKVVAEKIGDLHYEVLSELFLHLDYKIAKDSVKDKEAGRTKLSIHLFNVSLKIGSAYRYMCEAWKISKPFMND